MVWHGVLCYVVLCCNFFSITCLLLPKSSIFKHHISYCNVIFYITADALSEKRSEESIVLESSDAAVTQDPSLLLDVNSRVVVPHINLQSHVLFCKRYPCNAFFIAITFHVSYSVHSVFIFLTFTFNFTYTSLINIHIFSSNDHFFQCDETSSRSYWRTLP